MTSRYLIDIQNRKSKIIHVYRNGDKYNRASLVLLRPIEQQKLERIFKAIEEKVTLPYNKPIKRIFSLKGNEIDDPIMIKDQKYYVVSSSENFINARYGSIIKWAIIGPVKWSKFADVFYEPPSHDDMAVGNKILYRWKTTTTNSARLPTKMTKSLSAYPSDRKTARNSKMMTLSMDQSKRPISEPSNDMKDVNKNNTENGFFHLSDDKNSSGDNSITSPKLVSNRNHKSMDQFLNDSLKMYQLNDSNIEKEGKDIDHPEKDEGKFEEKSENMVDKIKDDEPVSLTKIEENQLDNELENSETLNVNKDPVEKSNENDQELSNCNEYNNNEKELQNTDDNGADDNDNDLVEKDDNKISENETHQNDDIPLQSHEIELELDKSDLESKDFKDLCDDENENHKNNYSHDDYDIKNKENACQNDNLVENESLMNNVVLENEKAEELIDDNIKNDENENENEEIREIENVDFTDNVKLGSDETNDALFKTDKGDSSSNVDDESVDSVKIDTDRSETEEEIDLPNIGNNEPNNTDIKENEKNEQIKKGDDKEDLLLKEHSHATESNKEISENEIDKIKLTDSVDIDQHNRSLNSSINNVNLSESTESNSDQDDGGVIGCFSSNFEKDEEIKDLHELIKSPCSELNVDDDENVNEDSLEQMKENFKDDIENSKDKFDTEMENCKNELDKTSEKSGDFSNEKYQSGDQHEINNEILNTKEDINCEDLYRNQFDKKKEDDEEIETDIDESEVEFDNTSKFKEKNIYSETSSEKNESDKDDDNSVKNKLNVDGNDSNDGNSIKNELTEDDNDNNNGYSGNNSVKIEDGEIDILNRNKKLSEDYQSNNDTEINVTDHSELCESVSVKDEHFDKLDELLSKRSKSQSISEHENSDNVNFDNKFDDSICNLQQDQKDFNDVTSDSDNNPKEQFNKVDLKLSDSSDCFEENINLHQNLSNQKDHQMNDNIEQYNRIDFKLDEPSNYINDKLSTDFSDNELQNTDKSYEDSSDRNNLEQFNRIDFKPDDPIAFLTDKTKSLTDVSENEDSELHEDDKVSNVTENSLKNSQSNIKDDSYLTENIDNFDNNDNNSSEKEVCKDNENLNLNIDEDEDKSEIKIDADHSPNLLHKELIEDDAALIIQKNYRGHLIRKDMSPHTQHVDIDNAPNSELDENEIRDENHDEKVNDVTDDLFQTHRQELNENDAAKIIQKSFREHLIKNDILSDNKHADTDEEIDSENELNRNDIENNESLSENEDSVKDNAAKIIQKNFREHLVRKDLSDNSKNPYSEDFHLENELNENHENDESNASMNLPQLSNENFEEDNAAKIIQKNYRGHLVRKELGDRTKHVNAEEDVESEGEQNRSYEQQDSEYDENDPDVNFSLMKDATNDLNTDEILDDHSQFDNSYPDDAFLVNNKP